ncbi:MAG: GNAT family N-acyltransferase [Deltaproteobacteria bacterium]|nr:GNAT family N-acyltransferase [Deltaproteobacteria bacterium]
MHSEPNLFPAAEAPFDVRLAETADELRQAQRLRYEVFGVELGARLPEAVNGLDADRFDARCDHLLVCERASRRVVGTYRMLPPQRAAAGDWYCADEFDCRRLLAHRAGIIELGRACVAPEYRTGLVIALLWAGVMRYVQACGATHVIGCASLDTADGGHLAATICRRLLRDHLAPPQWRVTPRRAFVLEGWREIENAPLPALIKGYLRLGAEVCGEPAWDPDFRTADLLVRLEVARANPRYVDRLLRAAA